MPGFNNRALDVMRYAKQQNSRLVSSRAVGYASGASAGIAKGVGRAAFSLPGSFALLGGVSAAMMYDPTKNTFGSHMAQEGLKLAADIPADLATFGVGMAGGAGAAMMMGAKTGGAVAGVAGMIGGIALSMGMYTLGLNPGQAVGKYLDQAGKKYRKESGMGPTPITRNQRTMRATQRGLNMLMQSRTSVATGVSGGHSMLGSEASFMHN